MNHIIDQVLKALGIRRTGEKHVNKVITKITSSLDQLKKGVELMEHSIRQNEIAVEKAMAKYLEEKAAKTAANDQLAATRAQAAKLHTNLSNLLA